jgi:RHS repeat-associated protein
MFYNVDSGLYLTRYRAYDPVPGRWLSRDPLGEQSDAVGNLYPYAAGNPVSLWDRNGLQIREEEQRTPEEELRRLEEEINPRVRGGLDYTPRPPQPPSNACIPEPEPWGPFSSRDSSGGRKGINTNVTPDQFIKNLLAQGYVARTVQGTNGPATILQNGQGSTYTVYTRTTTGAPGVQYSGPIGQSSKYRLGE